MSEDIESVYEQWCAFKASPEYHRMVVEAGFKPLFRGVEIATLEAYGKQRSDEVWRIEAYFSHLEGKPLGFATNMGKRDTYEQIGLWLASENIQRILVYKNGKLYQTITVNTEEMKHE